MNYCFLGRYETEKKPEELFSSVLSELPYFLTGDAKANERAMKNVARIANEMHTFPRKDMFREARMKKMQFAIADILSCYCTNAPQRKRILKLWDEIEMEVLCDGRKTKNY